MKRRFTGNELFKLRNLIPIETLIKEHLNIPYKNSEGYFRFLCPVCNEFLSATNPRTNLARCFFCERNFNPIDLVMVCKGLGFIESVRCLKKLLPELPDKKEIQKTQRRNIEELVEGIGKSITQKP